MGEWLFLFAEDDRCSLSYRAVVVQGAVGVGPWQNGSCTVACIGNVHVLYQRVREDKRIKKRKKERKESKEGKKMKNENITAKAHGDH